MSDALQADIERHAQLGVRLTNEIGKVLVGQDAMVTRLLTGHPTPLLEIGARAEVLARGAQDQAPCLGVGRHHRRDSKTLLELAVG